MSHYMFDLSKQIAANNSQARRVIIPNCKLRSARNVDGELENKGADILGDWSRANQCAQAHRRMRVETLKWRLGYW